MRILLKARARLGDALMCLPPARFLRQQGHEVWVDCREVWHPIFNWVSYVKPWSPHIGTPELVLDTNLADLTACEGTLIDHFAECFPALHEMPRGSRVHFDLRPDTPAYELPDRYVLISPFGYSQYRTPPAEWIIRKAGRLVGSARNFFCLTDVPKAGLRIPSVTAGSVADLPALLERAEEVITINSAPNIICSAVRKSHFLVWDNDPVGGRTNYCVPHQVVVHLEPDSGESLDQWHDKRKIEGARVADEEPSGPVLERAVWNFLGEFITSHGITSMAVFRCGDWVQELSPLAGINLFYGLEFSTDRVARLRESIGGRGRVIYAPDPKTPELPSGVDLIIIRDILEGMNRSRQLNLIRKCSRYPYCLYVVRNSSFTGLAQSGYADGTGSRPPLDPATWGARPVFHSGEISLYLGGGGRTP